MSEEVKTPETLNVPIAPETKKFKAKRDIFRFNGEVTTAINLEHVTNIDLQGKRITFQFYNICRFIDMADEAAAANVYEVLLNTWSADVVE